MTRVPVQVKITSFIVAALLACMAFIVVDADPAHAAIEKGWNKTKTVYYEKGRAVAGAKKIDGTWRAFNMRGKLMKKTFTIGDITYYPDKKGVLCAQKYKGKFYYANGKRMTKADTMDFECLLKARSVLASITKASDSKAAKTRKAFNWVMGKQYVAHRVFSFYTVGWPSIYAMDHFENRGGTCVADAAAFAYLAAEIGYTDINVCTDREISRDVEITHTWCMIGKRAFDPLFAEAKDYNKYYNSLDAGYEKYPKARFPVPSYSSKHASAKSPSIPKRARPVGAMKGLVEQDGNLYYYKNSEPVKSKWVTIGSNEYYFNSKGVGKLKS